MQGRAVALQRVQGVARALVLVPLPQRAQVRAVALGSVRARVRRQPVAQVQVRALVSARAAAEALQGATVQTRTTVRGSATRAAPIDPTR